MDEGERANLVNFRLLGLRSQNETVKQIALQQLPLPSGSLPSNVGLDGRPRNHDPFARKLLERSHHLHLHLVGMGDCSLCSVFHDTSKRNRDVGDHEHHLVSRSHLP